MLILLPPATLSPEGLPKNSQSTDQSSGLVHYTYPAVSIRPSLRPHPFRNPAGHFFLQTLTLSSSIASPPWGLRSEESRSCARRPSPHGQTWCPARQALRGLPNPRDLESLPTRTSQTPGLKAASLFVALFRYASIRQKQSVRHHVLIHLSWNCSVHSSVPACGLAIGI